MIYNFGKKLLFKYIVTWFVNELVSIVRRLIFFKSKNNIHLIYFFIYFIIYLSINFHLFINRIYVNKNLINKNN